MAAPVTDPRTEHTVLIVDDEPEILEGLRRTLRHEGYRIVTTTSPKEALKLVEEGGVDLLLSDIDMPEMDGIELVARVRRSRPQVVRLLLTGDASLRSALHAINEGEVHRYLLKPWKKDELRATLREALNRLDELRRAAAADRRATLREKILRELEREHPGISSFTLSEDGVYMLDRAQIEEVLPELATPRLKSLLEGTALTPDPAEDPTMRKP